MEAKLCLVLMLLILGSLTVQGAIPRSQRKNPLAALSKRQKLYGVCVVFIYCSISLFVAWLHIARD